MLVLKRKTDERILIGPDVSIVVVRCKNGSTMLGIDAPRSVTILRGELVETPKEESSTEGKQS